MAARSFIPFHLPSIGRAEIQEVVKTLKSGWLTTGPRTKQFEEEFRLAVQAPHAIAVNSCTAGLHIALSALGIGPGQEVITTPLTFCSTVNTIVHTGATPVFADVDEHGNIDPESIASRITAATAALLPVHLAGRPCDMEAIWSLARRYGLRVVEDAAHAAGTLYHRYPTGAGLPPAAFQSDAVSFSFYATKNLTTGEGGMVTTHDRALADRMRVLAMHGLDRNAWTRYTDTGSWYYEAVEHGFKYNLTDIQSAIGIHQLRRLEEFTATRARYAAIYHEQLAGVPELEVPAAPSNGRHAWHLYMIRLRLDRLSIDRARFIEELRARKIGASVHFIPVPRHPAFARYASLPQNHCPRAEELYPRLVSLPLYPAMSEEQVRYVAGTVRRIAASARTATHLHVAHA